MTESRVRLAIVGCGAAAEQCHIAGLPLAPEVELVALVDPVRSHAERLARIHESRGNVRPTVVSDVAEVTGDIEGAVIASPHDTHETLAIQLANAGVHCLIEKPLALSTKQCDRIDAAGQANDVLMAVAHVRRLFPASAWVRNKLRSGELGQLRRIDWREGAPYDWPLASPSLFDITASGGGVLADSGPHVFDLLLWWLGPELEVRSYRDSSLGGAESEAEVELSIQDLRLHLGFSRLRVQRNTCVIEGTEGSLEVGTDMDAPYTLRDGSGRELERGVVEAAPPAQAVWERLFSEQLRNFAAALRGDEAVYATVEDGRRTVQLIEQCYEKREPLAMPWREWGDA